MSNTNTEDSLHQQALDAQAAGRLQEEEAASLLEQALTVDAIRHAFQVQLAVIRILLGQYAAAAQVPRAAMTGAP